MPEADQGQLLPAGLVDEGFQSAREGLGRFNLAVFGVTGAGKSTLLNAVFGAEVAQTGIGRPVTQGSRLYRHESSQLGVFDTKGLEIGSDNSAILSELRTFVDNNRLGALSDQIHVIWYCVRAGDRRIQPAESAFIHQVSGLGIPVVLVMTQTPRTAAGEVHPDAVTLAEAVAALRLPVADGIIHINAQADDFSGTPAFGLQELMEATAKVAPKGVRSALAAAQRVSRAQKASQARTRIAAAEHRIKGKFFLHDVGRNWIELFAEIASIYEIPEEDAREVFERIRTLMRLRRMVNAASNGAFYVAIALPFIGAPRALSKAKHRADRPEVDVPVAWDEGGADDVSDEDRQRIGSGFEAGRVTRGIGEAWLETCEGYWSQAFPQTPSIDDPQQMAQDFADDLFERLPRLLQRWEERQQRKAAQDRPGGWG